MATRQFINYFPRRNFSYLTRFLSIKFPEKLINCPKVRQLNSCSKLSIFPGWSQAVVSNPRIEQRRNYAGTFRPSKKGKKPTVSLKDEELAKVIDVGSMRRQFEEVVENYRRDMARSVNLRTSVGSLETLRVAYEGKEYPLNEIAQVTRKSPQLVVVNLAGFPQGIQAVLEAMRGSGMNLIPQQEGTTLYVPVPKVTREYREALAKNAKALCVKAKENLRNVQNKFVKRSKQCEGELSADLVFKAQQSVMAMAEERAAQMEKMLAAKESEILGK